MIYVEITQDNLFGTGHREIFDPLLEINQGSLTTSLTDFYFIFKESFVFSMIKWKRTSTYNYFRCLVKKIRLLIRFETKLVIFYLQTICLLFEQITINITRLKYSLNTMYNNHNYFISKQRFLKITLDLKLKHICCIFI